MSSAARTAAPASRIPAPHVVVVQLHSDWSTWGAVTGCGATHAGTVASLETGNGRAEDLISAVTLPGLNAGCADSISAAVPATSGAEKLVPSDQLKLSV